MMANRFQSDSELSIVLARHCRDTFSGKTTLLNAIAARGPVTSGEVWYGATPSVFSSSRASRLECTIESSNVRGPLALQKTLMSPNTVVG